MRPTAIVALLTYPLLSAALINATYEGLKPNANVPVPYKGLDIGGFTVYSPQVGLTPASGNRYIAFSQQDYAYMELASQATGENDTAVFSSMYMACLSDYDGGYYNGGVTNASDCTVEVVAGAGRGVFGKAITSKKLVFSPLKGSTKMQFYDLSGLKGSFIQFLMTEGQAATSIYLDNFAYTLPTR